MNEHVNELLSAYLDDELSEGEVSIVRNHLAECIACQAELEELQIIKDEMVAYYRSIEIPNFQFEQAVMNKIGELQPQSTATYKWIAGMLTIFFTILLAILLFTFNDAFYVGITVTSVVVKVMVSLSRAFASVLSSVPFLVELSAVTTIIIVGISVWSLRYLLRTKTVE